MKLEGKLSIITGGGTGLGKAMALEFANAGADVVVCSRNKDNIEKARDEIMALGKRSLAIVTDVCVKEQVANMVKKVIDEFGKIDILVNNAGIGGGYTPILDLTEDIWDTILDTNLKGLFLCTQAVAKHMVEQKCGKIINIASTVALGSIEVGGSAYTASKFGVAGFTKASAMEFGPYGINVNAIAPGRIPTERSRAHPTPELVKHFEVGKAACVLGRLGTPEEIAHLALFLASDDASFVNAELIACNGGRTNLMGR